MSRAFVVCAWGHAVIFGETQEGDAREAFEAACMVASLGGDEPSRAIRAGEIQNYSPETMERFTQAAQEADVTVHRCDLGEPYPWDGPIDSELITSAARNLARQLVATSTPERKYPGMTEPFNPYGQTHGLN